MLKPGPAPAGAAQGWPLVLTLFVITTAVESFGAGQVFRFIPLCLHELGTPNALIPCWTGLLSATAFLFGLPPVPFWGVWPLLAGRLLMLAGVGLALRAET